MFRFLSCGAAGRAAGGSQRVPPPVRGQKPVATGKAKLSTPVERITLPGNQAINKASKENNILANEINKIPPRVQSRINLQTGEKDIGWEHVVRRHFSGNPNASQFLISQKQLASILQSRKAIDSPVMRIVDGGTRGARFVREVNFERIIGIDKVTENQPTSIMTIMTDKYGNLVTAFPGRLQ